MLSHLDKLLHINNGPRCSMIVKYYGSVHSVLNSSLNPNTRVVCLLCVITRERFQRHLWKTTVMEGWLIFLLQITSFAFMASPAPGLPSSNGLNKLTFLLETGKYREKRSGGFPKFPIIKVNERSDSLMCGSRTIDHRPMIPNYKIVGGSIPPYGAYPWQVGIQMYKDHLASYEHHCGGALIGPQLVLTAAHCIKPLEIRRMRVLIGDYSLQSHDDYQHTFKIEKFIVHPDFRKNGPYSNDIALIKLKGSSRVNSHVQYICLPDRNEEIMTGEWCIVSGWGASKAEYPDTISRELRAAAVPLLSLDKCRSDEIYGGRRQPILDSMICAGRLNGGVDACAGDSGGPLACKKNGKFYLQGIVSWGDGCAKKNRPGVYTRVSHYDKWIQEASKKLGT